MQPRVPGRALAVARARCEIAELEEALEAAWYSLPLSSLCCFLPMLRCIDRVYAEIDS